MVNPSEARIVFSKIEIASFNNSLVFLYLAEKCPIINCLAFEFFAVIAACLAVEWNVDFALSICLSKKVASWYIVSIFCNISEWLSWKRVSEQYAYDFGGVGSVVKSEFNIFSPDSKIKSELSLILIIFLR